MNNLIFLLGKKANEIWIWNKKYQTYVSEAQYFPSSRCRDLTATPTSSVKYLCLCAWRQSTLFEPDTLGLFVSLSAQRCHCLWRCDPWLRTNRFLSPPEQFCVLGWTLCNLFHPVTAEFIINQAYFYGPRNLESNALSFIRAASATRIRLKI